jgi:RNase P/RNase MRP subunit p30
MGLVSSIDLGVYISDSTSIESFIEIAKRIGLSGIATQFKGDSISDEQGFSVIVRTDVLGRGLNAIKKQTTRVRPQTMIVAVPLTTIEIANWAAEDSRVDLLTLDPSRAHQIRESTARLGASSGTCLEIQFAPLLDSIGLNRSKIIKAYREAIETASDVGMPVVLSSGAKHPLNMRSAMAMRHIGILLGLDSKSAETVVSKNPPKILERNKRRLSPDFVGEGIEIIERGGNE